MTAKEFEKLVREVAEPAGVTVLSDDGTCVMRDPYVDGWYVNLKAGPQIWAFVAEHTLSVASTKAALESLIHDMLTS